MNLMEQISIGISEFKKTRGHLPSFIYLNKDTFHKLGQEVTYSSNITKESQDTRNKILGLEVIFDEFLADDTFLFSRVRFLDVLRSVNKG